MDRTSEPELMDDVQQVQAYASADFTASDQASVARILALLAEGAGPGDRLRIVDLGCGPGNLTVPLAERLPKAEVVGIDGSRPMLAAAQQRASGGRPRFRLMQLQDLPPDLGRFDLLVSNSLLHHLHDPGLLWRTVLRLAAPGALVVVKDLRRPATPAEVDDLVLRHAAGAPPVLQRDYRASLHAAFRPEEVRQQLQRSGLMTLQVQPLEDRYLEVWGRLP